MILFIVVALVAFFSTFFLKSVRL